jgi:flagellar biosynthesis protein FliP
MSHVVTNGVQIKCECCAASGYTSRQNAMSLVKLENEIFPKDDDLKIYRSVMHTRLQSLQQQIDAQTENVVTEQVEHPATHVLNPAFAESPVKASFYVIFCIYRIYLSTLTEAASPRGQNGVNIKRY